MKKNNKLGDALDAIVKLVDNQSWSRGHPHRWTEVSLPLAHAPACVEVVSKMFDKASVVYKQIIEDW
jgi:hypothetical protein